MGMQDYFSRPETIERIRTCWIGPAIEKYVDWLSQNQYGARNIWRRVPLLMHFGEFARASGASHLTDLPKYVDAFVAQYATERQDHKQPRSRFVTEARNPVEQMLQLVIPGFERRRSRKCPQPFQKQAPGVFDYLRHERGLSELTIRGYRIQLHRFEVYLAKVAVLRLRGITPVILDGFIADRSREVGKKALKVACAALRMLLRYAYRQRLIQRDLAAAVESPRTYRLSDVPRAITWEEVHRVLGIVDRRTPAGRRDYAILLLLVTYGLRAREVAGLRLEDIDWRRGQIHVVDRKAGHSTTYPLARAVGDALVDYLKHGRPKSAQREVFLRALAPHYGMTFALVAHLARSYIRKAGLKVPRPGSHTLRHTCVQRLVDADFPLKTIGDYVGHRAPDSTQVYAKVALRTLRELGCGDIEGLL